MVPGCGATAVRSNAIAVDIGPQALSAPAPAASLTTIANLALEGRDLLAAIRGKTFSGNVLGGSWRFDLTGASHGAIAVTFQAASKGPIVTAAAKDLVVQGTMTFGSTSRPITIRASEAKISGVAELVVDVLAGTTPGTTKAGCSR